MNVLIKKHLEAYDLDIRKSNDARFMDQKVQPDVINIIAICIINYFNEVSKNKFTANDIWKSDFTMQSVPLIFDKVNLNNKKAANEYDKFFSQPLRMLAYSKILKLKKVGNRNYYKINNFKLLDYLSISELNCIDFLNIYLQKVLIDSNLIEVFNSFYLDPSKHTFYNLKETFKNFLVKYTSIKSIKYEPSRIFTTIINPIAYVNKYHGTVRGFMSKNIIDYETIMYNRVNWRDLKKKKNETRNEFLNRKNKYQKRQEAHRSFSENSIKNKIRNKYQNISLINDELSTGLANHVHHIFMKEEFPKFCTYPENLILLTPSQHLNKAHPNNNTRYVDRNYQIECLLKINKLVDDDQNDNISFYSKEYFCEILNTGYNTNKFSTDLSSVDIKNYLLDYKL